jgi:hypothetical protein
MSGHLRAQQYTKASSDFSLGSLVPGWVS